MPEWSRMPFLSTKPRSGTTGFAVVLVADVLPSPGSASAHIAASFVTDLHKAGQEEHCDSRLEGVSVVACGQHHFVLDTSHSCCPIPRLAHEDPIKRRSGVAKHVQSRAGLLSLTCAQFLVLGCTSLLCGAAPFPSQPFLVPPPPPVCVIVGNHVLAEER